MSAPWVCSTPLGSLVEPEVWTITMGSAGVTAAPAAATTSSADRSPAGNLQWSTGVHARTGIE